MRVKNHKRLMRIKDLIDQEGYVGVESLAARFGCSPATIRRDLQELEHTHTVTRTHGGAYSRAAQSLVVGGGQGGAELANHLLIVGRALDLIHAGDTIYLDPGLLTEQLAAAIRARFTTEPLTIITGSAVVFMQLAENANLDLILLGGQYQRPTHSFNGPLTQRLLADLIIEKYFMTTSGIVSGYGLTESDQRECEVKRAVLGRARQVFVLADASRFRTRGLYLLTPLSRVDQIITDAPLTTEQRQSLGAESTKLIVADAVPAQ